MQPIQLSEASARKIYPTAPQEIKQMLEDSFPKNFFSQKIADRIQGWSDILSITGSDASEFRPRPGETDDELAYREAKLISLAYNEGRLMDASNTDQRKYYPYHEIVKDANKPSGVGLACSAYVYWSSYSYVGVRLCFFDPNHAIDAGKKFNSVYERLKIR